MAFNQLPSFIEFQRQCSSPLPLQPRTFPDKICRSMEGAGPASNHIKEQRETVHQYDLSNTNHRYLALRALCTERMARKPTTREPVIVVEPVRKIPRGDPCLILDCKSKGLSGGYCKTHGGGRRCEIVGCGKSSQSMGLCRKHGGGKPCAFEGCWAGRQRAGFCHRVSTFQVNIFVKSLFILKIML